MYPHEKEQVKGFAGEETKCIFHYHTDYGEYWIARGVQTGKVLLLAESFGKIYIETQERLKEIIKYNMKEIYSLHKMLKILEPERLTAEDTNETKVD